MSAKSESLGDEFDRSAEALGKLYKEIGVFEEL